MHHYEVRDVMTADPVTVTLATPIKDLAAILAKQRIGALPVLSPYGLRVGLVTAADLLRKEQLQRDPDGQHSVHLSYRARRDIATAQTAGEIMTRHPATVRADATVAEAARLMDRHQAGCLLVVDEGGKLLGVVSPRDLLAGHTGSDPTPVGTLVPVPGDTATCPRLPFGPQTKG